MPIAAYCKIACQSQSPYNGVITTGGGFSTFYPQPSWQKAAVTQYFAGAVQACDIDWNRSAIESAIIIIHHSKFVDMYIPSRACQARSSLLHL